MKLHGKDSSWYFLKKYLVYYTDSPDKDLADWEIKDVGGQETLITDLNEDTPYFIRMQAITPDGPGIISDEYEAKTGLKREPSQ